MRFRFWLKLFVFSLPFTIAFVAFTGILIYSGESMPLSMVVAMQQGDEPVLYRPRYGNRDLTFKLMSTEARQPEVLALGSSRVLQFRSMFFNLDTSVFYNGAGPAWSLERIDQFVRSLSPDALPNVLILGIDQVWFNPNFVPDTFEPEVNDFAEIFLVNRSVFQETLDGPRPPNFAQLLARREPGFGGTALGIRAITDGHGFRNDGSEQYGDFLIAHWLNPETERNRHLEWMRNGEEMYVRGDSVSDASLQLFESFLQYCQEHSITVVGFFPPFAPTLYDEMSAGGQHTYIPQASEEVSKLMTQYGNFFFDYSDGGLFGNDGDFFDGWHGSERINLQLYIAMSQTLPDVLGVYSDIPALQRIVSEATDTFNLFGNQF
jgi:hypothetical protein